MVFAICSSFRLFFTLKKILRSAVRVSNVMTLLSYFEDGSIQTFIKWQQLVSKTRPYVPRPVARSPFKSISFIIFSAFAGIVVSSISSKFNCLNVSVEKCRRDFSVTIFSTFQVTELRHSAVKVLWAASTSYLIRNGSFTYFNASRPTTEIASEAMSVHRSLKTMAKRNKHEILLELTLLGIPIFWPIFFGSVFSVHLISTPERTYDIFTQPKCFSFVRRLVSVGDLSKQTERK